VFVILVHDGCPRIRVIRNSQPLPVVEPKPLGEWWMEALRQRKTHPFGGRGHIKETAMITGSNLDNLCDGVAL
jgi:hypothetical protein